MEQSETAMAPQIQSKSVSLILPAWNETAAIGRAILEADQALRKIAPRYEIIVVDDGSKDDTAAQVLRLAESNPSIRLIQHEVNRGYGAALRSGFAAATCDLVMFTDADSQFDLNELDRFVLLSGSYQIVCGYRIDRKDPFLRCFYSRVYNKLVRVLLGTEVRDVDCAMKMFHREVVQDLIITTNGFLVNSELLTQAKQKGVSLVEVGVTHRPRTEGTSSVSITHIPVVIASLLRYWWNQVQFPATHEPSRVSDGSSNRSAERWLGWSQIILLAIAAIVLFSNLGYPLIDRDETRYAEIPREMLVSGNWILPQLNYQPYYDKPVLLYWLCAASYTVFGISAWSARLVPALFGMGTLAVTLWFGNRLAGRRVSLLAGVALLLSVGFLGASRALLIDGVLTFFTTVSLFAAYEAIRDSRFNSYWWIVSATACGFAFLTKGPISLVLLAPPVLAYCWLTQRDSRPSYLHWLLLLGIVFAVAAPWFVAVAYQDSNFAYEFFYKHNVTRFAGAFHEQPFWYFMPVLMVAGFPWSILTIPCLGFLSSRQSIEQRTPLLGYLSLWSGWCFLFFSISRCKLPTYIMPAAPALALIVAAYMQHVLFSKDEHWYLVAGRKLSPWLATITTCVAGVGFGIIAFITGLESRSVAWGMIAAWTIAGGVALAMRRANKDCHVAWAFATATAMLLACVALYREVPKIAQARSVFAAGGPAHVDGADAEHLPIVTVGREWPAIPFELGRNDVRNFQQLDSPELKRYAADHSRFLVVMQRIQDSADLEKHLPEQTELTRIAEHGPAKWIMATTKPDFGPVTAAKVQKPARR